MSHARCIKAMKTPNQEQTSDVQLGRRAISTYLLLYRLQCLLCTSMYTQDHSAICQTLLTAS